MPRPKPATWRAAPRTSPLPRLSVGQQTALAEALGLDALRPEALTVCAALVGAWPALRDAADPTLGAQRAALRQLAAQAAQLRQTVRALDDDTRARMAALRGAQSAPTTGPTTDLLVDLIARLRLAEQLCEAVGRALDAEPPRTREKQPGRTEWLVAAIAGFQAHATEPRSAKARRLFVDRLADVAGVPLPASARVLDRLLVLAARVPDRDAGAVLASLVSL